MLQSIDTENLSLLERTSSKNFLLALDYNTSIMSPKLYGPILNTKENGVIVVVEWRLFSLKSAINSAI